MNKKGVTSGVEIGFVGTTVINFIKESGKKIPDEAEELGGVQVLDVKV